MRASQSFRGWLDLTIPLSGSGALSDAYALHVSVDIDRRALIHYSGSHR
ncbi:hypothetical protein MNJPNG_01365 [Cupriavidus oxalaticus]